MLSHYLYRPAIGQCSEADNMYSECCSALQAHLLFLGSVEQEASTVISAASRVSTRAAS